MRLALAAHDEVVTPLINTSDVDSVESRAMVVLQASAE
jgi:hypothetical protein